MQLTKPIAGQVGAPCGLLGGVLLGCVLLGGVLASGPAEAQLGDWLERPLVITNARVLSMDGRDLPSGAVLIRGGKIERVASDAARLDVPLLARRLDAGGRTLTPGLIDIHSALGMPQGAANADPRCRAVDAFDRYGTEALRAALRQGVTAVFVGAVGTPGIGGAGVVMRLEPVAGNTEAIGVEMAASEVVGIDLGSALRPLDRLRVFNAVRDQLLAARAHHEALERYRLELEGYEKKLAEGGGVEPKAAPARAPDAGAPAPAPDRPRRRRQRTDLPAADAGSAAAAAVTPQGTVAGEVEPAGADRNDESEPSSAAAADEVAPKPGRDADAKAPAGRDAPKKLEKPVEPRRSAELEALFGVLDRSQPVRIRADRSSDILNALDLIREFGLDATLEGVAEGHLVAPAIAHAEVPVILTEQALGPSGEPLASLAHRCAMLRESGVSVGVGSGGVDATRSGFVLLAAQRAGRLGESTPLDRVTSEAAALLRIGDHVGRVRAGCFADLVLWSADPTDPSARAEVVIVGGRIVIDDTTPPNAGSEGVR
ncbi:MAG: hypothetical protein AB7O52_16445 [Planctomycetota bacterium]